MLAIVPKNDRLKMLCFRSAYPGIFAFRISVSKRCHSLNKNPVDFADERPVIYTYASLCDKVVLEPQLHGPESLARAGHLVSD